MRLLTISFVILFLSCATSKQTAEKATTKTDQMWLDEGYTSVTVKDFSSLDGCGFLLETEKKALYRPANLAPIYQKNDLKVWLKYHTAKSSMSTCMKGTSILIDDIQVRI